MYDKGEGVSKDDREAVKWYQKAAEHGLATVTWHGSVFECCNLIRRYEPSPLTIFAKDGPTTFVQKVGVNSVVRKVIELG